MSEKRMLIVPAELVRKIDGNRGDLSRVEFIELLIEDKLEENAQGSEATANYVTVEALAEFEHGIKELMRSFLDFFVSYGLELGKPNGNNDLDKLTKQLKELESSEQSPYPGRHSEA